MILFADFDRTLFFREDDGKTRANLDAIKKWRSAGNQFCITTGRSYRSVTEQLPEMKELCDYYIVDGGSIILSKTGEPLKAFYFDPAVVAGIIEFSKNISREVPAAYYYTLGAEDANYRTENITKLRLWFTDVSLLSPVAALIRVKFPVYAFILEAGMPTHQALAGRNGFVEIIPIGLGKSNAIKQLLQIENRPSNDAVTIGDGLNDLEMVKDFDGYAIEGSELAATHQHKTASSVSSLIELLLQ